MRNQSAFSLLFLAFWINACNPVLQPSPSPIPYPISTPPKTDITTTPSFANTIASDKNTLSCSLFIETYWGNEEGEWGDPKKRVEKMHDLFPPPAFDEKGSLYIADFPNHRLLKYDNEDSVPAEIPLPELYFYNPNSYPFQEPWGAIEITDSNILVPYGQNKLGILRLDGEEEKVIELPYRYSLVASPWSLIQVDGGGGLIVNGEKHAYFSDGWKDGQWKEISSSPAPQLGLFTWGKFIGIEAWAGTKISLYIIDSSTDFFDDTHSLITINLPVSGSSQIIGVDRIGRVYLYLTQWGESTPTYMRYSIPLATSQISTVPDIHPEQIIQSGVAPDGTLYLIVYDREDSTVQPKIIKCRFPEDE